MRILIIGSEGNIGSKLVPYLRSKEHSIYRADQIQGSGEDYSVVNILSVGDLFSVFSLFKPDVVFHLAAMVSRITCERSPYLTVDTNLSGLNNVIQQCNVFYSKLIYFSTSEVYGNIGGYLSEDRECKPNNLYGLTKYLGEKLVQYSSNNWMIVRPFMIYDEDETRGEHRSAMIRFADNLSWRNKITVHKGSKRSWLHISDAIAILEKLMYFDKEIVNLGSNELLPVKYIAQTMCNELGLNYNNHVIEVELPERMTLEKYPDIRKQIELTGIVPEVNVKEGIKRVLNKFSYDKR